ncbi:phosphate acetyltransferase [Microbacteriaceae bacterium MWH-Ta3]|nr:phosphate acetyltransferase [Microbacteriaceae bacterium MWH-Ta3]
MATSIYITSAEEHSGKSTVALGVLDALLRQGMRVGVFRPISSNVDERDYVLESLLAHDGVDLAYDECIGVTYDALHHDYEAALVTIIDRYHTMERKCEAVVIVGSDYTDVSGPTELSFNARIAANLGAPVLLVLQGRGSNDGARGGLVVQPPRTITEITNLAEVALPELEKEHATLFGVIANRVEPGQEAAVIEALRTAAPAALVAAIPEDKFLVAPTVSAVIAALGGTVVSGDPELLNREVMGAKVAAMNIENVLARLIEGEIVLVPADRSEILLGVLMAHESDTFPSLAAIVLYGGFVTPEPVWRLIRGLNPQLPIIEVEHSTYETVMRVMETRSRLAADSQRKYDTALALFENNVDRHELLERLNVARADVVTPLMFEYDLLERARSNRKHIVLPEGSDDRILRAAATLLSRKVADLTILGDETDIRRRASELGIDISAAAVISPNSELFVQQFAEVYADLRKHKGITIDEAREIVTDVSYFGTMMVHLGLADGMVSGAAHTTAHTIKPSFEIIKTIPGVSVVSSVFLMALADRVLVYGDCAVIPDPTSEQLADIAISSATTAQQFGIEPRIAMLSYSTGTSGAGDDVEKVREATRIVRERRPDLLVEGPIQYDAAAEPSVAATKMPDSEVAGRATVYIFPDLNTGNNTYKAVQRSAGAVAIGPVLQGLNKPVNDLSRGALVSDIVNTVAITAIQAQESGA